MLSGLNHNSPLVPPNKYPIILIKSPVANPETSFVGTPLSPTYILSPTDPKSEPYLNIPLNNIPSEGADPNANANKTNSARQGVNPTGEFGGYGSPQEWAEKDPKGYQEANNTVTGSGIKIGYGG